VHINKSSKSLTGQACRVSGTRRCRYHSDRRRKMF